MSGAAVEIYLRTIATGDGAKRVAQDYASLVAAAKQAHRAVTEEAKRAAKEQAAAAKQAAKETADAAAQAARAQAAAAKQAAQQVVAAAKQAAAEQKAAADSVPPMPDASGGTPGPSGGKAAKSGGRGRALLELGRVAQDAMYGFGGILNNVEGLAQAAGLGSKMAGGFTLAGVALSIFGPQLLEWLASLDKRGAALNDLVSTLERAKTALGGSNTGNAENADRIKAEQEAERKAEREHFESINKALQDRLELFTKLQAAEQTMRQRKNDAAAKDLAAQNLPQDQLTFETLSRQRAELDQAYREKIQLAAQEDKTSQDQLANAREALRRADERVARNEEERNVARRMKFLFGEQERIEKALAAARLITETNVTGPNLAKAQKDVERLTKELADNKTAREETKRSSPGGNVLTDDNAKSRLDAANADREAAAQKVREAEAVEKKRKEQADIDAALRDDLYRRQAEEIERARRAAMPNLPYLPGAVPPLPAPGEPGWGPVIDPNNFRQPWSGMPQVPGAPPAPLPQAFYAPLPPQAQFPQVQMPQVPGVPTQPALPAPGQPTAYSAPQAMPWVPGAPTQPALPPPPGMGGQSTATADAGPVKTAVDAAAASNEAAKLAIIEAMQTMVQQNTQLAARVAQIASQTRNSRGGYS